MTAATARNAVVAAPRHGRAGGRLGEIALASVTVVCAFGMRRLFINDTFLRDVIIMGLASHLVAAASRRAGLKGSGALISAGCFVLTATALRYADTAWFVIPTEATLRRAREQLHAGWLEANEASAPVATLPGLVLMAGGALWVVAYLADRAAFSARAHAFAIAPSAALFTFIAVVGVPEGRLAFATVYCAAVAATLVVLKQRDGHRNRWLETRPGQGLSSLGRTGATTAAIAVLAGSVLAPMLPGAAALPWFDLPGLDNSGGSRVVLSPLVQMRSRLVEQSQRELFTVAVPEESPQYWRLMSLDEFDGEFWKARSRFESAAAAPRPPLDHPSEVDHPSEGTLLVHTVSLAALDTDYLPAAHVLRRVIDDGGVPMEYERSSGALIRARRSAGLPRRFSYTAESVVTSIEDPERLRDTGTAGLEPGFLAFNTRLGDDVSELVRAEALRVTATADSDYRRALDLQDYFWAEGRFSYDTRVEASHGVEDLEDFLFGVRTGHCEQFASAYAVMARSIGLPARVAVGFTWGEWDPGRGVYSVRGEHAHAWPEVYFAGAGWVRFEPTPGRGAPGDLAVTGRFANQAGFDPTVPVPEPDEVPASGPIPSPPDPGTRSAGSARAPAAAAPATAATAAAADTARWVFWVVAATGAAGLGAAAVPALRHLQRRRRRADLASDPAGCIEAAWGDVLGALKMIGADPRAVETPLELAGRVRAENRLSGPVDEMAALVTHGRYAANTTSAAAGRAMDAADEVMAACRRQSSLRRRLAAALNPSTIFS